MATKKAETKPAVKAAVPAKKASTAVAKVETKKVEIVPSDMNSMFAQHAGEGLERASARDFALPFLQLLQKGNPQVDENDDAYIEGAKPGMFLNTVTGELFDEIEVIPCDFHKVFNEWVPRDAGGGFVASHATSDIAEKSKRDDTQIVETANHYVLLKDGEGNWSPAILSLTSTKLKASRNWNSQIAQRMINTPQGRKMAPSFACKYIVTSQSDKNEHGTFFTIGAITPVEGDAGWVSETEVFQMALMFREQIKQGIAKVKYEGQGAPGEDPVDDKHEKY